MIRIGIQSTTKVIFAAVFVFAEAANAAPQTLTSIDGTKLLPDHMISLFYDDGPDVHTLAPTGTVLNVANQNYLANYLNSQRVSVTFNVVGAFPPFSSPHLPPTAAADGSGYLNYSLNYPNSFLSSIIKLGHRLGNHTLNHVPLASGFANDQTRLYSAASAPWFNPISDLDAKSFDGIKYQVLKQFTYLSPYISNGLYTLTPPGGLWDANSDGPLVGDYPVLLRIDPENSYKVGSKKLFMTPLSYCGNAPATSGTYDVSVNASDWCYARLQLPASQYAQDLIDSISAYTAANANGFYLFNHDRNEGAVGSTYALDVAKIVIPYLKQNGYVFVGPIINFSKIVSSAPFPDSEGWIADSAYYQTFRSADIDGDGHADVCARGGAGIFCSLSTTVAPNGLGSNPVVQFGNEQLWETTQFTDANGWNDARYAMTIMLADVNGDGKADLIARNAAGILVATSNGQGFNSPQMWLSGNNAFSNSDIDPATGDSVWLEAGHYNTFRTADVNGDGYADICARGVQGVVCALNNTHGGFLPYTLWEPSHLTNAGGWRDVRYSSTIMLADVNGDGKADLIARNGGGLVVYLSNGNGFAASPSGESWTSGTDFSNSDVQNGISMNWLTDPSHYLTFRAADINGDGKADICARGPSGMVCVLSNGSRFLKATNWEPAQTPQFNDANGWNDAAHAATIMLGDTNGDNRADVIAKNLMGLVNGFAP